MTWWTRGPWTSGKGEVVQIPFLGAKCALEPVSERILGHLCTLSVAKLFPLRQLKPSLSGFEWHVSYIGEWPSVVLKGHYTHFIMRVGSCY